MEKNFHFINQRLENLKTIKPMLMSLRTISLSSWKLSLKKLGHLEKYKNEIDHIAEQIGLRRSVKERDPREETVLIILGSTRGLCGGFNRDLYAYLAEQQLIAPEKAHQVVLFGEKMGRLFASNQTEYDRLFPYPKINQITYAYIADWVDQITSGVHPLTIKIAHHSYQGSGRYRTLIREIHFAHADFEMLENQQDNLIIDTDVQKLSEFILNQQNLLEIYQSLLSSLAAEHSTRFQLMDNAISNTDKLIQELQIMVQVERQKKITSEMRELSSSAGLLGHP